ncbi:MAG: T9SS C-terminal target domain-containing protein, partial [Calditrichaeota bacterium]
TNTEPDFAGYRIAWRYADSLFYEMITPVGNVTEYTLSGLTPDIPIYISYSALDVDGNESIFSNEVLVTPRNLPATPQNFNSTSTPSHIQLGWTANRELDLANYIITRTDPDNNTVTFTVDTSQTQFLDNTAQPHVFYQYTIQAEDADGNLSPPSSPVFGQLATHDMGILVIDDSKDGPGGNLLFPTDEEVDTYYNQILSNFTIAGEWDIADSVALGKELLDAHLGVFSTVILHSDVRIPDNPIKNHTTALRKYVENGGNLLFTGWQLVSSASGINQTEMDFSPGDFVYDVMLLDSVLTNPQLDFTGGSPQLPGYPQVAVDSNKVPPSFGGRLTAMEAFSSLAFPNETEVIYQYISSANPPSPLNGEPVAIRHLGSSPKLIIIGFPLYYMEQSSAQQIITQALLDFGEVSGIEDPTQNSAPSFAEIELFQNFPNPFNPKTLISYRLPVATEIELAVYNVLGQKIATLVTGFQKAGTYSVEWNGKDDNGIDVATGIYLFRLHAGNYIKVRKMILLR